MTKNRRMRSGRLLYTGVSGLLASLVMFFFIYLAINLAGIAPFNIPPSAAFLYNIGVEDRIYSLLLHFCYGTLWSYVLVYTFEEDVSIRKALVLSVVLWFFMMVVYSPLIGWGIFGFGYAHMLAPDHPLYLAPGPAYPVSTLALHLLYGLVLGYLNARKFSGEEEAGEL
ncbi:MAG: hypothetical protein U5K31_03215 [Balneolaceae bacterium]|nr:hypothetical protein [Balneolaceae bacterium]